MFQKTVATRPIGCVIRLGLLAITLGAWAFPADAASQSPFSWTAPAECPGQPSVLARVRDLMGRNVDTTASADIYVERADNAYKAELRLVSSAGAGTRTVQHADCAVLADSVALIYALAASRSDEAQKLRWTLALYGAGVLGTLPALAGGGRAALGVEWSRLRVELSAASTWPQTASFGDGKLSGRFELAAASIGASILFEVGALAAALGLGVEAYRLSATGLGGESSRTGWSLGYGPLLSLLLRWRFSNRWALCLSASSVAPVVRSRFVFTDAGTLHEVPSLTGSIGLGLELRL